MVNSLHITQIIIAAFLIVIILMQVRGEGAALFGAAESTGRVRRGLDRVLFNATIVLCVMFLVVALLSARLS